MKTFSRTLVLTLLVPLGTLISLPMLAQTPSQEPLNWVRSKECIPSSGVYDKTKTIKQDGTGTYPYSCAGLQQSMDDWASSGLDESWKVTIDTGLVCSTSGSALVLKPKAIGSGLPTKCIVYVSNNPPTQGETLCSHGITDSYSRNPGCTNDISHLWTVETTSTNTNVITTNNLTDVNGNGPSHIMLRFFEARPASTVTSANAPVQLGTGSETTTAALPSHIHVQYAYVHGDATDSGPGNNSVANAFTLNCTYCSIMYTYTDKLIRPGSEGHQVSIVQNSGPFKINHNWFEGQSIGVFLGGQTPAISGLVSAYDGEIRGNRFTYAPAWIGLQPTQGSMERKNAGEAKEGIRILWDGNIFENVDQTGGQGAPCFVQDVRSCSAGAPCNNYATILQDVTVSNNIFRSCLGLQNDARSGGSSNGNAVSYGGLRLDYINNLIYNANPTVYCVGGGNCTPYRIPGFASSGSNFTCSAQRDASGSTSTLTCTDAGTGFHQTDINVGDHVQVTSCADATFDTPTAALGPAALSGTTPTGLTVVYSNSGTANATTTGCTLYNRQGFWTNLVWTHNTIIANTGSTGSTFGPEQSSGPDNPFPVSATFQNTLWALTGWTGFGCNGTSEGTHAESRCWDTTTFTLNHDVFAERTATNYTEYPTAAGTLWFPTTVPCSTSIPDSSCVGLVGMMNTITYNQDPTDYHDLALCTGVGTPDSRCGGASYFAAGQPGQASDGTSLGSDLNAIDNALTRTQYVCTGSCGSGPYPD